MSSRSPALLVLLAALALPLLLRRAPPATPRPGFAVPPASLPSAAPSYTAPVASVLPLDAGQDIPALIGELIRTGRFEDALALADTLPATLDGTRQECFASLFAAWARTRPAEGPALAGLLLRHAEEPAVFEAFARGWAESSPAGLADHALGLPPGPDRNAALAIALDRWILLAPAEVADWLPRLADPAEFDRAAGLLVERADTLLLPTQSALAWAGNLSDPALRLRALTRVLREWAGQDPAAARRFAESAPDLAPEHRPLLIAALRVPVPET